MPVPVLLAETDVLLAAGIRHALQDHRDFDLRYPPLRDQRSLEEALAAEARSIGLIAELLVSDLAQLARFASERACSLVLITTRSNVSIFTEMPAIRGAVRRDMDERQLLACLHAVAVGKRWCTPVQDAAPDTTGARILAQLSPRQVRVMSGVSRGAKNVEIARELGTSEQVVKNMLGSIYDLAGVSDRLELALFVLHHPELAEAAHNSTGTDLQNGAAPEASGV